jgi:hypothetical protein
MHYISKHLSFLLLSGIIAVFSSKSFADYGNPFLPIYAKGDNLNQAAIKPKIVYEEVKNSKTIISNMPAYKTQDDIGDCRGFSLAAVVQHYTCTKWKEDIPDCKNPPSDSAISYMGMMAYTNQVPNQSNTFQPNQTEARGMPEIIDSLSKSGNRLILDSCKPFDALVNNFSKSGQAGLDKKDRFFNYLKNLYNNKKNKTEADIADCPDCLDIINKTSGLNVNLINLKKALTKESYDKFLYSLFFEGCKMENFPSGFSARAYPLDDMNVTPTDLKNKIKEGLKQGRPVLFPALCVSGDKGDECKMAHSLVVSGYKRVCEVGNTAKCKDVVKLHNSWGADWQRMNNDGWVDADIFVQNAAKIKTNSGYRIGSASVIWLDP